VVRRDSLLNSSRVMERLKKLEKACGG
jgi:hypothetical protein